MPHSPASHPEDRRQVHYRELGPAGQIDQRKNRSDSGEVTLRLERREVIAPSPFGQKYPFKQAYLLGETVVALETKDGFRICVGQFLEMTDSYDEFLPGDILEIDSIQIDFESGDASLFAIVDSPMEPDHASQGFSTHHISLDFTLFRVMAQPGDIPGTDIGETEFSPRQLRDGLLLNAQYNTSYDSEGLQKAIESEEVIPTIAEAVRRLLQEKVLDLSSARISEVMQQTGSALWESASIYASNAIRRLFMHWLGAEAGARGSNIRKILSEEDRRRFPISPSPSPLP